MALLGLVEGGAEEGMVVPANQVDGEVCDPNGGSDLGSFDGAEFLLERPEDRLHLPGLDDKVDVHRRLGLDVHVHGVGADHRPLRADS